MGPSLFWDFTQRGLVVVPLRKLVTNYQHTLRIIPEE
jgi:hypothetical protein